MSFTLSKAVNPTKVFIEQKINVTTRWDPHYHSPRFAHLNPELDAIDAKPIHKLSQSIFSGITPLSGGDAYTDSPDGIAFVRSGDFNEDGTINEDALIHLKPDIHQKLMRRSQLKAQDVLFAIVGATIGKVGIFPGGYEANINQAVCAVRLDGAVLPHFLHAFFLTRLGQQQIDRVKRPVARANINLEEVGTLRVPALDERVQTAVVDALKKAFSQKVATEERASRLLQGIDDALLDELGIPRKPDPPNTLESRIFQRGFSEVTGRRFDPIANQVKYRQLEQLIHSARFPVVALRKVVGVSKTLVDTITEGESYVGLENIAGESGEFIATTEKKSVGTAIQFVAGQILFPKLRPYLNKTHLATFGGICSTEFHVFTPQGVSGDYLTAFLRSRVIVSITSLLMTGNTLPRLQISDIEQLPVPVPPPDVQKKLCTKINDLQEKARTLREQARADLEKAKRDIEALILGKEAAE